MRNSDTGTVLVAMSGGVDSSTTAFLLKEQGFDVVGITMRLFDDDERDMQIGRPCCSSTMSARAAAVCRQLDIPHYVVDFRNEFKRDVIDDFYRQYLEGMTPNPCVRCNTFIKWEPLVQKKNQINAHYIATGHYARIIRNQKTGKHEMHRGADRSKDQSYFLWGLTGEHLSFTFFPLGDMTKKEVKHLAEKYNLASAAVPESMEICFIPDNDYRNFVNKRLQEEGKTIPQGEFRDTAGNVIGAHSGYHNFTIGQRKKLGLSLGKKAFVKEIVPEKNIVVVGDEEEIKTDTLEAHSVNWINGIPDEEDLTAEIKIRYRDKGTPGRIKIDPANNSLVNVAFDRPVKAVTPGQSVVFYHKDRVLGGGVIAGEVRRS